MAEKANNIKIRKLGLNEDVSKVVDLHVQVFRANFTGEIGKKFLVFYFKRILSMPCGIILLAEKDNGDLCGFAAGLATKKGFLNLKFGIYGTVVTLWQLCARPSVFVLILRHLKRMFTSTHDCDAELLSLAVKKDLRQSGIGRNLVEELERFFGKRDVSKYEAFTDMTHGKGYLFYGKLGFKLQRKVVLFGLVAHLYCKEIKTAKKILLLNPGAPNITMRGLMRERPTEIGFCWPSTDIVITSGVLDEKGFSLHYLDASIDKLSVQNVNKKITEDGIDVIVSLYSRYLKENDVNFLKQIKEANPNIIIAVLPDMQFVLDNQKALDFIKENSWLDAIVLNMVDNGLDKYLNNQYSGDLKNLCYRIGSRINIGPIVSFGENSYSLPIPRHDLFKNKKYFLPQSRSLNITTTVMHFGCPYNCDFCLDKLAYKKSWCRSPENMLEEFEYIASCGFNEVYIRDLTFGINRSNTVKFCELLIENKIPLRWVCTSRVDTLDKELLTLMKKAGCMCIEFGVESVSDSTNKAHNKGIKKDKVIEIFSICREFGIETTAFMMLGFPEEEMDDMKRSIQFCFDIKADFIALNLANALPGTEFADKKEGIAQSKNSWENISYFDSRSFSHPNISKDEIDSVYKDALKKFYLSPDFIFRRLAKVNSLGALLRIIQMGTSLLLLRSKKTKEVF